MAAAGFVVIEVENETDIDNYIGHAFSHRKR